MTLTPEQRDDWRANALQGGTGWPHETLALLDALTAAETALASIMAREEEVGQDEGWQIGGAWGDYGEVVVPLRILSYVVGGELDQKIVSTDPGYAATYAEQVARAEAAEAARDTAERQVQAVEDVLAVGVPGYHASGVPLGLVCKVSDIRRALDAEAGR